MAAVNCGDSRIANGVAKATLEDNKGAVPARGADKGSLYKDARRWWDGSGDY